MSKISMPCEDALLILLRAHNALAAAVDVMIKCQEIGFTETEPYVQVARATLTILHDVTEHEGSAEITAALRRRLYTEREFIESLPPLSTATAR